MNNLSQKEAFLEFEADGWFQRNKNYIFNYSTENDRILSCLKNYSMSPLSVLEVGCSAGYRLNGIKKIYPDSNVYGVEPSKEAIEYGKLKYPDVSFLHSTADDLSHFKDETFDLVIVGFVFYVVDRGLLIKSIAEIDRVLKNKGFIVLIDFFSEATVKRNYHHINDPGAFSFKQNYDEIFTATRLYHLLDRSTYSSATNEINASEEFQNLISISLLKKDNYASYR